MNDWKSAVLAVTGLFVTSPCLANDTLLARTATGRYAFEDAPDQVATMQAMVIATADGDPVARLAVLQVAGSGATGIYVNDAKVSFACVVSADGKVLEQLHRVEDGTRTCQLPKDIDERVIQVLRGSVGQRVVAPLAFFAEILLPEGRGQMSDIRDFQVISKEQGPRWPVDVLKLKPQNPRKKPLEPLDEVGQFIAETLDPLTNDLGGDLNTPPPWTDPAPDPNTPGGVDTGNGGGDTNQSGNSGDDGDGTTNPDDGGQHGPPRGHGGMVHCKYETKESDEGLHEVSSCE